MYANVPMPGDTLCFQVLLIKMLSVRFNFALKASVTAILEDFVHTLTIIAPVLLQPADV